MNVLNVWCMECNAAPGDPCITRSGKSRTPHQVRLSLAVKEEGTE